MSAVFTRLTFVLSRRWKLFDMPDGYRKIHTEPIPRLGGIAIYIAFFTTIGLSYLFRDMSQLVQRTVLPNATVSGMTGLLGGSTILLLTGIVDDLRGVTPLRKLFFQVLAALAAYYGGFHIGAITVPFIGSVSFAVFALPITVLWFVGCINAVNLLDGMDGLASGACMFVFLTLLLVGLNFGNTSGMMTACAAGATLGFLVFNFPPARIFLGDSGSMLLGFLVATLSLVGTSRKAEAAVALFIPIVALGLPIFDTSMAIVRRWYRRLPLSTPDRQHIHHILVSMGYSQQKSVLILYGICVALAVAALLVTIGGDEMETLVIGSLLILGFVAIRLFSGVRLRGALSKMLQDNLNRQREIKARVLLEKTVFQLQAAQTMQDAWNICTDACSGWVLDSAELYLEHDVSTHAADFHWTRDGSTTGTAIHDAWSTTLVLHSNTVRLGHLVLSQGTVFSHALPDILVEFRDSFATTIARVSKQSLT